MIQTKMQVLYYKNESNSDTSYVPSFRIIQKPKVAGNLYRTAIHVYAYVVTP